MNSEAIYLVDVTNHTKVFSWEISIPGTVVNVPQDNAISRSYTHSTALVKGKNCRGNVTIPTSSRELLLDRFTSLRWGYLTHPIPNGDTPLNTMFGGAAGIFSTTHQPLHSYMKGL